MSENRELTQARDGLQSQVDNLQDQLETQTQKASNNGLEARGLQEQFEGKLSSAIASTETKDAQLTEHLPKIESDEEERNTAGYGDGH